LNNRASHILSQIESYAPNKEKYSLIAKVVNVGVALLVYARDDGLARKVKDVQMQWTGCGPLHMGNKGAVGVRFRVEETGDVVGEVYTYVSSKFHPYAIPSTDAICRFVCAHLSAHEHLLQQRIQDYQHIISTLLFQPTHNSATKEPCTIYSTSHLFLLGDLNFRVALPENHPMYSTLRSNETAQALESEDIREQLKEYDQLLNEKKKETTLHGLREGEFWKFKCSYKYVIGEVDTYRFVYLPITQSQAYIFLSV
jgi:hypothetical protein